MARVYATYANLVDYAPDGVTVPADPEATRMLTRASERVDRALLTAIYAVDTNGMPTDTLVIEQMKNAACAQAVWWLETGDETGAASQLSNVTAGRISLGRGSRGSGSSSSGSEPDLCHAAMIHLALASILPGYIMTVG